MPAYISTSDYEAAKAARVTKPKLYDEQIALLVKGGTKARIDEVRGELNQADFVRKALDDAIAKARRRMTVG
jgi:hypothetical protein